MAAAASAVHHSHGTITVHLEERKEGKRNFKQVLKQTVNFDCLAACFPSYLYQETPRQVGLMVERYLSLQTRDPKDPQRMVSESVMEKLLEQMVDHNETMLLNRVVHDLPAPDYVPLAARAVRIGHAKSASILARVCSEERVNTPFLAEVQVGRNTYKLTTTLLHVAVQGQDLPTVTEILILPHLHIDAFDGLGRTALDLAKFICIQHIKSPELLRGAKRVVDFLTRYGAKVAVDTSRDHLSEPQRRQIRYNLTACLKDIISQCLSEKPESTPPEIREKILELTGLKPPLSFVQKLVDQAHASR